MKYVDDDYQLWEITLIKYENRTLRLFAPAIVNEDKVLSSRGVIFEDIDIDIKVFLESLINNYGDIKIINKQAVYKLIEVSKLCDMEK